MKYDFHIHSKYSSDGILEPEEIVKIAIKKGLDGVAITDHNTIKGGLIAKKYEKNNFKVIIGSEIETEKGEITGLFLKKEINTRKFKKVVREIKKQKGIVIIPHPFDSLRKTRFKLKREDIKFIDALEVFNSRCIFQSQNAEAYNFALKNKLCMIAGSDAHFKWEIGNAGIITSEKDIKKAIINRNIKIFGKKLFILTIINHILTKILKISRKIFRQRKW